MKQLYTFLLMLPVMLFAQTDIDFQSINSGLPGPSWTWTADVDNTSFDVIDNPYSTSINTSTKVGKLTAEAGSDPWALAFSDGIGNFTFDADNTTVKIMVYKTRISPVEIKFEDSGNSAIYAVTVSNTKVNEWEELTFDFYNAIGSTFNKIVVIPDNLARTDAQFITYFDNITFTTGTPPAMPSVAATTPTESSSDVISIFSDAYTDITANFSPPWDTADISEITVEGDAVKMYSNMTTAGIDFTAVDVSSHGSIKIDYWTEGAEFLKVKLVDYLADGNWGTDNYQKEITHNISDFSTWNTITINLADFNLPVGKIGQILLTSDKTKNVYVDNIYFSSTTITVVDAVPSEAAPSPTEDEADVISIFSDAYNDIAANFNPNWDDADMEDILINTNTTKKYTNFVFAGIDFTASQDVSALGSIKLDYWTEGSQVIKVELVDYLADGNWGNDNYKKQLSFDITTNSAWNTLTINLSDFALPSGKIGQILLSSDNSSPVYIDNIYFSSTTAVVEPDPAPTDAPSTPPSRNASDVISIFGEAYGTEIGLNNVDWDTGSESTVESIASNDVLKISFNDFIGFDLGSVINATDMTHVHMDVWIGDAYGVGQVLKPTWSNHAGGNGQTDAFENIYNVGQEDSRKWISLDYEFANSSTTAGQGKEARAELAQFLIGAAATLDIIYVDNIYLYKDATASVDDVNSNFNVYPNPVQNTLNVSAGVSVDQVSIFDLTGREVMRATPNASAFSLDVANLNKGLYLVSLKAGDQELTTKLVK